ncbi:MAG: GxxExxY protein [Phenylobacterium sp.]
MEPPQDREQLLLGPEVFQIQGAIYEVSRTMGPGFLEAVYQGCLALEFARRGIPHRAMPLLSLSYKGVPLKQTYSPDFVCFDAVIVEIKAGRSLAPEHRAQVLNYLRATGLRVGLLVHFGGAAKAQVERLVQ